MKKAASVSTRLASIVAALASEKRVELARLKANHRDLERPDFLWHYLLQSFATMGRASGAKGLIESPDNYRKVTYEALAALPPSDRSNQVYETCRLAKVRMPAKKAAYIVACFEQVQQLGGPEAAREQLLALPGRDKKIGFLKHFKGIGEKYARNIMMDVYHEDFRDSIAIDVRITKLSTALGVSFASYHEHEEFYLGVARAVGVNGWELDRLLFWNTKEVLYRLGIKADAVS